MRETAINKGAAKVMEDRTQAAYELASQQNIERSNSLRSLKEQTVVDTGLTKLVGDSVDARGQRTLQTMIRNDTGLSDLKDQTAVDSGIAKATSDFIDSRGNEKLQKTIRDDDGLSQMVSDTVSHTKRAETAKNTVNNRAEENWNNSIRDDSEILNEELGLKSSEKHAGLAKEKVEKMHAEVIAQGRDNDFIRNHATSSPATAASMLNLAQDIKDTHMETLFTSTAKSMAERATAEEKVNILKDDILTIDGESVVNYSAGIKGAVGARSVVAQAKTESSKFILDDIKNIESTLEFDVSSNPAELFNRFKHPDATDAERVAYTSIMGKRGGPGAEKLRDMMREMERRLNEGEITRDDMDGFKELVVAQNPNILGLGKDLEFFLTNASYNQAFEDPELAGKIRGFDDLANDVGTWSNLSADAFSRMNIVNQMHGLRTLAHKDPEAYRALVSDILSSPSTRANMKAKVISAIARKEDGEFVVGPDGKIEMIPPTDRSWSTGKYNLPSKDELTEFEKHVMTEPERTVFNPRNDEDGDMQDSDFWREKYDRLRRKTEEMLDDAESRGIDYRTAPDHKPKE